MKASISYPGFQRLRAAPLWQLLAAANAPAIIAILAEHLYEADHGMRASEFYARVDRSLEELRATGVDMPSTAREYASQWLAPVSYTHLGFLLTQAVGVTLWNTALIPLLWIMSGMASAMGCIELLAISGRIPHEKVLWSRRTSLWVEAAELFTIFAFVHVATSSTSAAARAGAEALLSGPQAMMFLVGAVLCGSLIPFAINLTTRSHKVVAVGAVLGIVGALLLRASVLFAGYYEPILL